MDSVLVSAPISQTKDYVLSDYMDSVLNLRYPCDYYFVDNSKDPDYHKNFINCDHIEPRGNVIDFIAESQNKIRDYFLQGNWEWLMMIECDVIVPPETIGYLLHYNLPVVGASYFVRYHNQKPTICWLDIDDYAYGSTFLVGTEAAMMRVNGEVQQVFSCGLGCVLINRAVLEEVSFRSKAKTNEISEGSVFSDSNFFIDLLKANIPVHLDTGFHVEHRYQSWDSNPDLYV